jgi:hypothetical protein
MNLKDFRSQPALVEYAAKTLSNPKFKVLLEVMREEHPKNYRNEKDLREESANKKLGRIEGYDEFEANLLAAAVPEMASHEEPEATFQPPEDK